MSVFYCLVFYIHFYSSEFLTKVSNTINLFIQQIFEPGIFPSFWRYSNEQNGQKLLTKHCQGSLLTIQEYKMKKTHFKPQSGTHFDREKQMRIKQDIWHPYVRREMQIIDDVEGLERKERETESD